MEKAHVVALLSGGLDSILAAKLMERQGIRVACLHFVTPFFGFPDKIMHWEATYGLTIQVVDICDDFVAMMVSRPAYGFGKVLNPCVNCKILMLQKARMIMEELGACAIVTGEVLGQRPMSQRRETLNVIQRDAGVKGILLRPLTALHLDPTQPELDGLVDREQLLRIAGRGRKDQLELAAKFGLKEIPTPAGGCKLAETEVSRNYWQVLKYIANPVASDFFLASTGRQLWSNDENARWLMVGRDQATNDELMRLASLEDILFKVQDFAGPIALGRCIAEGWNQEQIAHTASLVASYSSKTMRHVAENGGTVVVRVHKGSLDAPWETLNVVPARLTTMWREGDWLVAREEIKAEARLAAMQKQ